LTTAHAGIRDVILRTRFGALLALGALLAGCGEDGSRTGAGTSLPTFDDPNLATGRSVWMANCRNCHLTGVAGAPAIGDPAAWVPRFARGRDALQASALDGIGHAGAWRMPPRGGNPALSDTQVRQAVDYTIAAVEALGGTRVP
jgi:cytochrome c5